MKKGTKFVLILAAVVAVVGVGLTIGGFVAGATREIVRAYSEGYSTVLHGLMERGYFNHGVFSLENEENEASAYAYEVNTSHHSDADASETAHASGSPEVYTGKGTFRTYVGQETYISEIVVEADEADVIVCSADDAKYMPDDETILVEVTINDQRQSCSINTDNNELYIKETFDTSSTLFTKDLSQKNAEIKIYLPEVIRYSLFSIDVDAGDITLKRDLDCENVTIDINTGDIEADHEINVFGDMDIFCDVGDIEMDRIICDGNLTISMSVGDLDLYCDVTGNLDAKCDVGDMDIHLPGNPEDYNYDISVDAGELEMGHNKSYGFGKDIQLTNNPSGSTIILQSNAGDVELLFNE